MTDLSIMPNINEEEKKQDHHNIAGGSSSSTSKSNNDIRWCEGGDDRYGEYGVIGAEQADESYYTNDKYNGMDEQTGRIKFSTKKLYGRDIELDKFRYYYNSLNNKSSNSGTVDVDDDDGSLGLSSQIIFLSGYSGSGKSAIINEFVTRLRKDKLPYALIEGKYAELRTADPFSGICDGINRWCKKLTNEDRYELRRIQMEMSETVGEDAQVLVDLIPSLSKLVYGDNNNQVMGDESWGHMSLAGHMSVGSTTSRASTVLGREVKANKARIIYVFQCLMRSLCTKERPFIIFMDDLQWADDASLELLSSMLKDKQLKHMMFIGAYRSNEVSENHPLTALITDIKDKKKMNNNNNNADKDTDNDDVVEIMELSELSKSDIGEFIGDTLGLEINEVTELSDAVYNKTLGNVFFTMQAIEQLVRKNALFYDTMIFTWQWNLSRYEIENELSDGILDMVKSKIQHMPKVLQKTLINASYIRTIFDVSTLLDVMDATSSTFCSSSSVSSNDNNGSNNNNNETNKMKTMMTKNDLIKILNIAIFEGLLVEITPNEEYAFAHDRIQEASRSLIVGNLRNQILVCIGNALMKRFTEEDVMEEGSSDWMVFTAASHLNAVPLHIHEDDMARKQVAQINLNAAKISINAGGFKESVTLLRAGLDCLSYYNENDNENDNEVTEVTTTSTKWDDNNYSLTIEFYHLLMDIEFGLGNFNIVEGHIDEVLENANCIKDKGPAYALSLGMIMLGKDRDHGKALRKGIDILSNTYGIYISAQDPDNVTSDDIDNEEQLCKQALGPNRQIIDLLDSFPIEDDSVLCILDRMVKASMLSGKIHFLFLLGRIAIRICAENGISEYLPRILVLSQMYYRKVKKDVTSAYQIAVTCKEMVDKISDITTETYCHVTQLCNNAFQLFRPSPTVVDAFYECYTKNLRVGDTEWAFLAAYSYGMSFLCSGISVSSITESKFAMIEEESRGCNQPPSVHVMFSVYRQYCLNLQNKSNNPYILDGKAMKEQDVLNHFKPNTGPYKQTRRDISICKMILGCIGNDKPTMIAMIDILKSWPDFDIVLHRLTMRLLWMSLGAFVLSRNYNNNNNTSSNNNKNKSSSSSKKKENTMKDGTSSTESSSSGGDNNGNGNNNNYYLEIGEKYLNYFHTHAYEMGNPNAKMAYLCLKAESKQSTKNYTAAIEICKELQFLHLEAIMNEHYGLYKLNQKSGLFETKKKKKCIAEIYLKQSIQLYYQYGAHFKVKQMKQQYSFLKDVVLN